MYKDIYVAQASKDFSAVSPKAIHDRRRLIR